MPFLCVSLGWFAPLARSPRRVIVSDGSAACRCVPGALSSRSAFPGRVALASRRSMVAGPGEGCQVEVLTGRQAGRSPSLATFTLRYLKGALWLPESDPHDLAAQNETPKLSKRRNAETQKQRITTIIATLMPFARPPLLCPRVSARRG
jgi:hypothetical protein